MFLGFCYIFKRVASRNTIKIKISRLFSHYLLLEDCGPTCTMTSQNAYTYAGMVTNIPVYPLDLWEVFVSLLQSVHICMFMLLSRKKLSKKEEWNVIILYRKSSYYVKTSEERTYHTKLLRCPCLPYTDICIITTRKHIGAITTKFNTEHPGKVSQLYKKVVKNIRHIRENIRK